MASRDHCVVRKPVSGNTVSAKTAGNQASKKNKSYKSAHSIGSRKATEKVITYNETLPFFPEMVQQFWSGKNSMDGKKRSASKKRHAASPPSDAVSEKRAKGT
ncbi:hypothetical protein C0Q70_07762 [Pomacea canaliculata]|uniref:Uncharacterized protein n=1 Tax=Pomacea canaliculata TaxID=400727 RepID=A0A2T7PFZ5_POMCA|nr:hypothetical protein C0Q70_07762 [Pomacea canaliculata]